MDEKEVKGNFEISKDDLTEEDPLKENIEKLEQKGFRESCSYALRNITVEPCMFLFVFCLVLNVLTSQNLNLEKACRVNLNFTEKICDSLKLQTVQGQNEYEREVQKLVTKAMAWRTYITASIPCILSLFIGSWSDRTGYRKTFLVYTITGQFLVCINGIVNTYLLKQVSLEFFVFSEAILDGLSGSWCVTFLTIYAYISTITNNENRTFRMGIVSFCLTVGFPVGMGLSGILLKKIGYYGCYGVVGALHIINWLYTTSILKNPTRTDEQKGVSMQLFKMFYLLYGIEPADGSCNGTR